MKIPIHYPLLIEANLNVFSTNSDFPPPSLCPKINFHMVITTYGPLILKQIQMQFLQTLICTCKNIYILLIHIGANLNVFSANSVFPQILSWQNYIFIWKTLYSAHSNENKSKCIFCELWFFNPRFVPRIIFECEIHYILPNS